MKITRRKFLGAAPILAGAILGLQGVGFGQTMTKDVPVKGVVPGPQVVGTDALARLKWDSFLPFVNTDFTFGDGANAVSLKLLDMTDTRPEGLKVPAGQECFIMKFQGPYQQPLKEGTYHVNHFNLGDFDLFITDGGRVKRTQYYIAVINRIVVTKSGLTR